MQVLTMLQVLKTEEFWSNCFSKTIFGTLKMALSEQKTLFNQNVYIGKLPINQKVPQNLHSTPQNLATSQAVPLYIYTTNCKHLQTA